MNINQLKSIALKVKKLGEEVRKHLGCGFNEVIYQSALAIEFRKSKIEYLKEVNIEIFYKGESLGVDRPDFIITRTGSYNVPILLELKVAAEDDPVIRDLIKTIKPPLREAIRPPKTSRQYERYSKPFEINLDACRNF